MIAHNNDRDRDVFQICPGTGTGVAVAGVAGPHGRRHLERIGAGVEPERRNGMASRAAGAARTATPCPRWPRIWPCTARCVRSPIRAARCTTPTARSSPTPACRWCCSWRTTTSTARLSRHARHDGEHRSRLRFGAGGDRHRVGGPGGGQERLIDRIAWRRVSDSGLSTPGQQRRRPTTDIVDFGLFQKPRATGES